VSGLTASTPYTFTVTATNVAGTGAASAASNSVSPTQTIAYVEDAANSGTNTSLSTTIGASAIGDTLIVQVASDHSGFPTAATVSSISGGGVTTWTKVIQTVAGTNNGETDIWYGQVASTTGNTSVTVNMSRSVGIELVNVSEWSGIATTSPVDANTGTSNTGPAFTAGPVTTTITGDLVLSDAWTSLTTASSPVSASGFTALAQKATTGYRGWAAYQIVGAAGSYPANWTQPGSTSGNYATSIAAFKPHP
jgi:hypothetical protein